MFAIAHDGWTHSYQSSGPKLKCLRTAYASSLSHQITDSSVHSFYAARSRRQIQFWIFSIGSEMVDTPEKLPNDHAHDAQACCLTNKIPEFFEHGLQLGAIGQLQSSPDLLVKRFAQGSVCQSVIASASAVLQSADEMKMAELYDPTLARAQPDYPRNLVGDRGPDASVNGGGDRCECLRPALHVLSPWQKHRIEEDGSILMARLDRHLIQDPVFSSKAQVKSVQDQRSSRQSNTPRSRYELPQLSPITAAEALRGKVVARGENFQCEPVHENFFQTSRTCSPRLVSSMFVPNSPRTLALTALTTPRTEVINFRSVTLRFRVPRVHARELHTDFGSKYPKTRGNFV